MKQLQTPLATGRTAEIFPYEDGQVLKLFFPTIPQSWIDQEMETGRSIQETQLPVPKVYERVKMHDREGLVYEKIAGPTLLNELARKPWTVVGSAQLLANLHAQVHAVTAPPHLQPQKDWARGGMAETNKLPKVLKENMLRLLASLPDGNQLCHGDFHPGNIIITPRGPIIIDWMTASRGVGLADVARASIILEAARTPDGTPLRWLLEWVRKLFLETYLKTYFQLRPVEKSSFSAWRAIMAANFLVDVSLPSEEKKLMAIVQRYVGAMAGG